MSKRLNKADRTKHVEKTSGYAVLITRTNGTDFFACGEGLPWFSVNRSDAINERRRLCAALSLPKSRTKVVKVRVEMLQD